MTLGELKSETERLCILGYENASVLITLSQKSVGARAAEEVRGIYSGFDWEAGQVRIEPKSAIVSEKISRDVKVPAVRIVCGGTSKRICPKCELKLRADDFYCARCGQAIAKGDEKIITY
jgi:hypothetical protein